MISEAEVKRLIDDVFEEEALLLGGLVAVHGLDDDFVWRYIKNLDVIRDNALGALDDSEPISVDVNPVRGPDLKPHPAIEDFLLKLRRS